MDYLYTAWFRDSLIHPEEQDYEWCACIVIDANTLEDAKTWGDHLARQFSGKSFSEQFLRSVTESTEGYADVDISSTPRIKYGYNATDEEIGW
ncbi:MAG: hypothetical protein K2Q17_16740 [Nitrospiraceae bacterium]|jgi:hypothetical protein|uniref:hypothetical protein n=1 Tax=Nitrospira cf. moscoviensis SBR1015 TaxID=96242 RepID=UPI000A0C9154|nr:hypothetical protein [Nitrospira cf. moscoviensis SBR1015]MBY0249309.1 hypothetical protein [Nitrospiraceae bacterium]OQW37069.1 MAG: hypothetical protein A4E20_05240 [Nitrospira sp. SG-bin2]